MSRTSPAMGSPESSRRRRRILTGALVIVAALGGVACGADDETATPSEPKADFAAYCEKSFEVESYFAEDPDVDFETASEAEVAAAVKTYLQGAKPLVDAVGPITPAEIKEPYDIQVAAFNQALAGADPEVVFDTPEVDTASDKVHAFDLRNCGWAKVQVSATEYSFSDLPAEVKAGRTSLELSNKGKELHEIVLLSKNPGVTESFDAILDLPEDQQRSKLTPGPAAFAAPGETEYVVADLAAGSYLAVCFIPQGLVSEEGPPPAEDAKPHVALGMKKEITVK